MSSRKSHLRVCRICEIVKLTAPFMICFIRFQCIVLCASRVFSVASDPLQIKNQFWTLNVNNLYIQFFFLVATLISVHLILVFFGTGIKEEKKHSTSKKLKSANGHQTISRWSALLSISATIHVRCCHKNVFIGGPIYKSIDKGNRKRTTVTFWNIVCAPFHSLIKDAKFKARCLLYGLTTHF